MTYSNQTTAQKLKEIEDQHRAQFLKGLLNDSARASFIQLEEYIVPLRAEARAVDTSPSDGWVDKKPINLLNMINEAEGADLIHEGMNVLDMGSGNGSSALIWAYAGYNVTGLELNPALASILTSERIAEFKAQFGLDTNLQIFEGNILTRKYLDEPVEQDSYEKHGLSLSDFNIFYAYVWPSISKKVMKIFAEADTKAGAILYLFPLHLNLADELKLKSKIGFYYKSQNTM